MQTADWESVKRLDCMHCKQSGVCTSGTEGSSCASCLKAARFRPPLDAATGLVCSVCGGVGKAEPKTLRFLNRFQPIFAAVFVAVLLVWLLVLAFVPNGTYFQQFLTFAGTAIGSVTGYYFGGANRHRDN